MATLFHRCSFATFNRTSRMPPRRKLCPTCISARQFHQSPSHRARDDEIDKREAAPGRQKAKREPFRWNLEDLDQDHRAAYEAASPEVRETMTDEARRFHEHMTDPKIESDMETAISRAVMDRQESMPRRNVAFGRQKPGLMAMGEPDEQEIGGDQEYEGDDITSLAHGELEQHRELREYARIAVWEMPLLHKLAKPFRPPSKDEPLRFRYTTYMGETHSGSKKIVLEFCTRDLPDLTEAQRIKLIKLVGVRYNPDTDVVKMSSEMFETAAQNKRYLGDLVDTLVAEAKDGKDMFEDLPLDFRHHKRKPKFEFPDGWKLNEGRKKQLEADRSRISDEERAREGMGMVLDGARIISEALAALPVRDDSQILSEAQQGRTKKGAKGRPARLR